MKRKYDWRKDNSRNNLRVNMFFRTIYARSIKSNFNGEEREKVAEALMKMFMQHSKKPNVSEEQCVDYLRHLFEPDYLPLVVSPKYRSNNMEEFFDLYKAMEFMAMFDSGSRWDLRVINHHESKECQLLRDSKLITFLKRHGGEMSL